MFFVYDKLGFFIWNLSTVGNVGVSRGRSVAVGISERWKVHVTRVMRHVTSDFLQVTHGFFFKQKIPEKVTEIAKNANNWLKSAKNGRTVQTGGIL